MATERSNERERSVATTSDDQECEQFDGKTRPPAVGPRGVYCTRTCVIDGLKRAAALRCVLSVMVETCRTAPRFYSQATYPMTAMT